MVLENDDYRIEFICFRNVDFLINRYYNDEFIYYASYICITWARLSIICVFILVWITYYAPIERLGTAVGWFWVSFAGGLNMLGPIIQVLHYHFRRDDDALECIDFTAIGAVLVLSFANLKYKNKFNN